MAISKLFGSLFIALLILDLSFAARSSHRRLQSSNADWSSASGPGSSWSTSSSVSGSCGVWSGYAGGAGNRRFEYSSLPYRSRSFGGGGGGGGGGRGGGAGGGGVFDFKAVTGGSGSGRVEGGGTIHGKQGSKGGLE